MADRPRHGYGILLEISELTAGAYAPQVATLYRTLDRMAADGTIVEHAQEVVDGRFRRTYRLTEQGRAQLANEASVRAATARVAKRRLRVSLADGLAAGGVS